MPLFEAMLIYEADDIRQAEELFAAIETALGCTDDEHHVCPHFRFAAGPYDIEAAERRWHKARRYANPKESA